MTTVTARNGAGTTEVARFCAASPGTPHRNRVRRCRIFELADHEVVILDRFDGQVPIEENDGLAVVHALDEGNRRHVDGVPNALEISYVDIGHRRPHRFNRPFADAR